VAITILSVKSNHLKYSIKTARALPKALGCNVVQGQACDFLRDLGAFLVRFSRDLGAFLVRFSRDLGAF
jgi:hypothetical protein